MAAESDMTAQEWKEKGNEELQKSNWSEASSHYTNALNLEENNEEKAALYENRAEAYLKLGDYEKVIENCDSTLKICCNRVLHRRCQALEALKKFEEAYRDAQIIISSDPDNEHIQSEVERLFKIVQEHRKRNSHISAKVSQMLDLALNTSLDMEKRETAMDNLQLLTHEKASAEVIFKEINLFKIAQLAQIERDEKIICSAIRIVDKLCKNNLNKSIMTNVLPWCLEMMNSTSFPTATKIIDASQNCLQNILNTYSGMNDEPDSKPDEAMCEEHKKEIDKILSCLLNSVASKTITGLARDAIIELITRNIHYTALDWAKQLVKFDGLKKLMEVASQLEEHEFSFDITSFTQTIVSMCLAKVYKEYNDNDTFIYIIDDFIEDKLCSPNRDSMYKVRVVVAITTLLLGPLDVADAIITKEKILKIIFAMSETNDKLEQKVVCECIALAITRYEKINVFIRESVTILENLYLSMYDSIHVRAMVCLCELSRFEESRLRDIAIFNPFLYGMTKLAKVCIRFLINPKEEKDIRKWAIKGLSYLTSRTEVKDELIKDQQVVKAMIEHAKTDDQSVLYVVTTLVNLCNTYDDEEPTPEIKKFVKYYFPKEHLREEDNFVNKRRRVLVCTGVTSALASLAKTNSKNIRELIARVFNAICILEEVREIVHQQGGTKALLSLAHNGTKNGKKHASRALVRLAHTISLEVAFPGDIMMDVVWPIVDLLDPDVSENENNETLSILRNLANFNDSMRLHIYKEIGYKKLMSCMCDYNHHMLRRTCAQLVHNLVLCRVIAIRYTEEHVFRKDNIYDKFVHLCMDKDQDTVKAVAGILAKITSVSVEACKLIMRSDSSLKSWHSLLTNPNDDIQCKGIKIVLNMMRSSKYVATNLNKIDIIMKQVRALSNNDTMQNKEIKKTASLALEAAAEWI